MTPDYEVRARFVPKIARLYLWYVRRLLARGEIRPDQVADALSRRVNLFRMTSLWDGDARHDPVYGYVHAEWNALAERLADMVRNSPADDTSALEEQGVALLQPLFDRRMPLDVGPPPTNPHGCWTYALAWEGIGDGPGLLGKLRSATHFEGWLRRKLGLPTKPSKDVELHFANVTIPASPFDDMPALARSLSALLKECRRLHPQTRRMWCHSWLNTHPAFLSLFPPEWSRRPILNPPGNYSSWWGQFKTRTGDFHDERARVFRENGGEFPFKGLLCRAEIDAMTAHLAARFNV